MRKPEVRGRSCALGRVVLIALVCLAWLGIASIAHAAPRIGVMTMQPGAIFFERFGHNALIVDDPARGEPISYNFGFFDLAEPGFVGRFAHGDMQYALVELPLAQDLTYYREVGRGVRIQWLNLTPGQAWQLADGLAWNARPENARYRYDYFTDNCSTRVRDALDGALGGRLRQQLEHRSQGSTYRSEAVRLASPAPWMWLGFDVGLGPWSDRPLTRWQEGFVPMRLADALRGMRGADGRPLVRSEVDVLPHRIAPEPRERERRLWPWLLTGLAIAGALAALAMRAPRMVAGVALGFWLVCGIAGVLLLYLWGFTEHRGAWANQNLLLLNPLCWLLLAGAWRGARGAVRPSPLFTAVLLCVLAGAGLALALHAFPVPAQRNGQWIALLLPVHVALAWAFLRRQRA